MANPAVRKNSAFKYNPLGLLGSGLASAGKAVGGFILGGITGSAKGIIKGGVPRVSGTGNVTVLKASTAVSQSYSPAPGAKDYKNTGTNPTTESKYSSTTSTPTELAGRKQPLDFKFNLPPHAWSLPVRPVDVNSLNQKKSMTEIGADIGFFNQTENEQIASFHGLRRGRIWRYQGLNYDIADPSTKQVAGASGTSVTGGSKPTEDDTWGFQFLWNPDSVNISVSINMDVTPSANDIFRTVVGAFPGLEYISVKVVLDRTNDFACFKAVSSDSLTNYTKYYLNRYPYEYKQDTVQQLTDLYTLGTGADLEYLFKTLNGNSLAGSGSWTNLIGKKTADIGFIQPAIIALQLGPTLDALSYVGWVNSLSINHVAFTETMIPLRTEVSFSMQTITGVGIASGQ